MKQLEKFPALIYDGTLITLFELKFDYFFLNRKLDNDDEKEESPENASEKTSKVYSDRKLADEGPLPWCQSDDLVFVRTHYMFSRILNFQFVIVYRKMVFCYQNCSDLL